MRKLRNWLILKKNGLAIKKTKKPNDLLQPELLVWFVMLGFLCRLDGIFQYFKAQCKHWLQFPRETESQIVTCLKFRLNQL